MPTLPRLVLRCLASRAAYTNLTRKYGNCRASGPARAIVNARLTLLGALALLPALWAQSSQAECRINGVEFDVGDGLDLASSLLIVATLLPSPI